MIHTEHIITLHGRSVNVKRQVTENQEAQKFVFIFAISEKSTELGGEYIPVGHCEIYKGTNIMRKMCYPLPFSRFFSFFGFFKMMGFVFFLNNCLLIIFFTTNWVPKLIYFVKIYRSNTITLGSRTLEINGRANSPSF